MCHEHPFVIIKMAGRLGFYDGKLLLFHNHVSNLQSTSMLFNKTPLINLITSPFQSLHCIQNFDRHRETKRPTHSQNTTQTSPTSYIKTTALLFFTRKLKIPYRISLFHRKTSSSYLSKKVPHLQTMQRGKQLREHLKSQKKKKKCNTQQQSQRRSKVCNKCKFAI